MDKRKNILNSTPYFSIILPAYNVPESYLRECMSTIAAQTFLDYEVVFVDDGSKDRTADICEGFADEYPNINVKCIRQSNSGQIAARMNGFDHSCGEHILFFDSDDTVKPNTLERIKYAFDKYDCDIVMFNAIRDYGDHQELFWNHYADKESLYIGEGLREFRKDAISSDRLNNVWLKSFKRGVIENAKRFDNVSFIRLSEDYLMQLPWFDEAKSIVYLPDNLYIYRMCMSSIVMSSSKKFNPLRFDSAKVLYEARKYYSSLWKIPNGDAVVNKRFFDDISSSIKQIRYCDESTDIKDLVSFLSKVASDSYFISEYPKFNGRLCVSQIGRIAIWLIHWRLYRIAIFVIKHDPKVHGEDKIK